MNPIKFKEANKLFTKPFNMNDKECGSLPVFSDGEHLISYWHASFKERIKFLFQGKIWLWIFGNSQPPVSLELNNPFGGKEAGGK